MPDEFRFFLLCQSIAKQAERGTSVNGIVNDLLVEADQETELMGVIGAVVRQEMWGKRLEVTLHRFDLSARAGNEERRLRVPGATSLILPLPEDCNEGGFFAFDYTLPRLETGIYWAELRDLDRTYRASNELLATYVFSATVTDRV